MKPGLLTLVAVLIAAFPATAQEAPAPAAAPSESVAWARITYLTTATAYLDAGREEGLREGAAADVVRGGAVIARVTVAFLSSHRASGKVEVSTATPHVGDSVRFVPVLRATSETEPPALARAAPGARGTRGAGRLHGRLGVRYLAVTDRSGIGSRFAQPALDARLDGTALGGTPIGISVDVRARRTLATHADGTTDANERYRVYRAALFWHPAASPARVTAGRQYSAALAPVSFFDGLSAEYLGSRVSAGLFGGAQPDPLSFGFSSAVREAGGYVQAHARPGEPRRWQVTAGAVGAYTAGEVDREFGYVQASYADRRVSFYAVQEIDYNRGWKRDAGEPSLAPTSTFASAMVRVGEGLSLRGGFDNRRNVRLYRDFETPETEFDDAYRQGWWGGVALAAGRLRVAGDLRTSRGGAAGPADAWTFSAGLTRLTAAALDLRVRSTRYDGAAADGWLHSVSVAAAPTARLRVEASGGLRRRNNPLDDPALSESRWVGLDVDLTLARSWYLILSGMRESGAEASQQLFGGVSWRF